MISTNISLHQVLFEKCVDKRNVENLSVLSFKQIIKSDNHYLHLKTQSPCLNNSLCHLCALNGIHSFKSNVGLMTYQM